MSINEIMMSLELGLIYGIAAIGVYLTFRVLDFPDLTCDGSFALGAASSAVVVKMNYSPWLALLVAFSAGSLAGSLTGALNTRLKITDLLSGILMAFMLYSVNIHVMGGTPSLTLPESMTIFSGSQKPIFLLLEVFLVICGAVAYLLVTDFGLAIRSIGQNKSLARGGGIDTKLVTVAGLSLSNGIIALSGALFSQHQGFADVGSGIGTLIIGLTSVMIGERLLAQRSVLVQLMSCLIGSVLYRLLVAFALHNEILGLETQDLNLVTGLLVIITMLIPKRRVC